MAYPGQPNYGQPNYGPPPYCTDPGYCPPPPPIIAYQTTGNCPSCRQGFLQSNITVLGVCCAIFLFPIGLICLFLLQEQRCPNCGFCVS